MIKVNYLTYNLHNQAGVDGFETWLSSHIGEGATILNIWYGEGLKVEIIVWDDGA